MENKLFSVSFENGKITISLDTNKDGEKSAELIVYGEEGLEEILNGISKIFKK